MIKRHSWFLMGALLSYAIACLLPCYDAAVMGGSNPIKGWECLTECYGLGFGNWFPNPILFVSWFLVLRCRSSAKYWAMAALVGAGMGVSNNFIWPGAGLWLTSMCLTIGAAFILQPAKGLLFSRLGRG